MRRIFFNKNNNHTEISLNYLLTFLKLQWHENENFRVQIVLSEHGNFHAHGPKHEY